MLQWKVRGWGRGEPGPKRAALRSALQSSRSDLSWEGAKGLGTSPYPRWAGFWGEGGTCQDPSAQPPCSEAASSSIASSPTPSIQLGTGSKRLAAPSPGRILPYRARTEPWGCPGSSLPLGGRILLCFFWRKSPASACRKERYLWGPRAQRRYRAAFGAHPGGRAAPRRTSHGGGGGCSSSSGPRGRHRLRLRREMGFGISGGVRCVPIGSIPVFFCPLLPRPVGPVEGAPGQQHVPD